MDKELKREQRRQRLMANKGYRAMCTATRYMERYYLDALIGLIPGWGDTITAVSSVPFLYFSIKVIKSVPLTLAIINNTLRDLLLGLIPFFVGDIIDIFHRSNTQNMAMIQGFVDGNEAIIRKVNQRAWQSAIAIAVMILLIIGIIWLLIAFGSYLTSLVLSLFSS